jgi:hypothetical protein
MNVFLGSIIVIGMVVSVYALLLKRLASLKLLPNFENAFSNLLSRPLSGDFDPEKAYRKPDVIL